MTPNISPPTDNIYKFSCLFGLALVISAIFSFVAIYSSSLEQKIKYSEALIPLESKEQRTKSEESIVSMNKKLLEITRSNEKTANWLIGVILAVGTVLSWYGASNWHKKIQARDDMHAMLLLEKLRAEITNLKLEAKALEKDEDSNKPKPA